MKKTIIFGLSILLAFLAPSSVLGATTFPDVPIYHEYANEIGYVKDNGIVSGFTDGTFRPDALITRAELTKIIVKTKYSVDEMASCLNNTIVESEEGEIFLDVDVNNLFAGFICVAKQEGIINGYSDGTYKPENNVTFGEASKIILRALEDKMLEIDVNSDLAIYLSFLVMKDSYPPTIAQMDKDHKVTRGEVSFLVQMINSNFVKLSDEPEKPTQTYNFMIKRSGTYAISEEGLNFKARNFGIHCTTSNNTFIDLDVTKDGQTQQIHLERSCTGLSGGQVQGESTHEADLYGYHFKLTKVLEQTAWDIDSFEFYIEVKSN